MTSSKPRTAAGRLHAAFDTGGWHKSYHDLLDEALAEAAGAPLREALERLLRFTHALTKADHEAPLRAGADLNDLYFAECAALAATPAPAPLDDSHGFPACMVCGAYLTDPEASEPCVPVTARAAATEDTP